MRSGDDIGVGEQALHGCLREDDPGASVREPSAVVADSIADVVWSAGVEMLQENSQGLRDEIGVVVDDEIPFFDRQLGVAGFQAGDELPLSVC